MADLVGETLGKYQIVEKLGRGGMAEVYKAYHASLDRYVAIKVMHAHLAESRGFQERFQLEAKAVASLRHENIIQVHDFDIQDGNYYMVMEYIPSISLQDKLEEGKKNAELMPYHQVFQIITQISQALGYAHRRDMLHRDLKPGNILIDHYGRAYLTDFGIAKIMGKSSVTMTGDLIGTPQYMSPEQCKGEDLTKASDLYSLGITLYEMVTGLAPFDADTPLAVIHQQISSPLPSPRTYRPDIPDSLEMVLYKLLSKDPVYRYQTAEEFLEAISQIGKQVPETMVIPSDKYLLSNNTVVERNLLSTLRVPAQDQLSVPIPNLTATDSHQKDRNRWLIPLIAILLIAIIICAFAVYSFNLRILGQVPFVAQQVDERDMGLESPSGLLDLGTNPSITPDAPVNSETYKPTETTEPTKTQPPTETTNGNQTIAITPNQTPIPLIHPLNGNDLTRITHDSAPDYNPSLSSDQRLLVYSTNIGEYWQLIEVDPNQPANKRQITRGNANYHHAHYSNDGETILVGSDLNGNYDIYLLDAQSGEVFQQLTNNISDDYSPYWLPDNSGYVFTSKRDGNDEIYLGTFDGKEPTRLTNDPGFDGFPTVSWNGKRIAFYSSRDGNYEVYIMQLDSHSLRPLTQDASRDSDPVFSPGDNWVIFDSDRSGNHELYAVRTDGSGLWNITNHPANEYVPRFSPDGKWLLFLSDRDGNIEIYRMPWVDW